MSYITCHHASSHDETWWALPTACRLYVWKVWRTMQILSARMAHFLSSYDETWARRAGWKSNSKLLIWWDRSKPFAIFWFFTTCLMRAKEMPAWLIIYIIIWWAMIFSLLRPRLEAIRTARAAENGQQIWMCVSQQDKNTRKGLPLNKAWIANNAAV